MKGIKKIALVFHHTFLVSIIHANLFAVSISNEPKLILNKYENLEKQSQIIESNSIEEITKFVKSTHTLVIFDYDNVIVEGELDRGFDAWFCAILEELEKNKLPRTVAVAKILPIYNEIQKTSKVKLVEECTKKLIADIQTSQNNLMILTIRSFCLCKSVFSQLKSVDINIKKNAIAENDINRRLSTVGSTYKNGVLFCDGHCKGQALKVFLLGNPELNIQKIVFIDDRLHNIESVESVTKELGLEFVGIRYGRTDARTKAYQLDDESKNIVRKILCDVANENPLNLSLDKFVTSTTSMPNA